MNDRDRSISRAIWALALGCFISALGYAIQANWLDTAPAPWLGPIGVALTSTGIVHEWLCSRAARKAKANAAEAGGGS